VLLAPQAVRGEGPQCDERLPLLWVKMQELSIKALRAAEIQVQLEVASTVERLGTFLENVQNGLLPIRETGQPRVQRCNKDL
jgi:hypothetical protein